MQHLNNLKHKIPGIKPPQHHKLDKAEYKEAVFKEKAKVTCQFILLVILSALFAGVFYAFQHVQHSP